MVGPCTVNMESRGEYRAAVAGSSPAIRTIPSCAFLHSPRDPIFVGSMSYSLVLCRKSALKPSRELFRSIFSFTSRHGFDILFAMDKQVKRHLERRGVRLKHGRPTKGLFGTNGGIDAFLKWFYEGVMGFDSTEYRRRFWHEAYRNGHTIGHMPRTVVEFTDPRRHTYNGWLGNLAVLVVAMGASAVVWYLVRTLDAHIRRLRRPTYYATERARRLELAEERRRIRRRSTTSPCPTPDMLRAAFGQARSSTVSMIRFGSMLEDLECFVDNSVVWSESEGRIVGRRGGIRQWLRENAPDLSERYKTVMKYKALAKKFRQAVGVSDPVPAAAVLPPETPEGNETEKMKGEQVIQEYSSEQARGGQARKARRQEKKGGRYLENRGVIGQGSAESSSRMPEEVVRGLLAACEGTVASLEAQLALMVSADFVPNKNIDRTKVAHGDGQLRNLDEQGLRSANVRQVRSSA